MALAIANEWLKSDSYKEKKALLGVLKLIAVGHSETGPRTLSDRVIDLSDKGYQMGIDYDPQTKVTTGNSEFKIRLLEYIRDQMDTEASNKYSTHMLSWGVESPLDPVRIKMGIKPTNERDITFHILKKPLRKWLKT